MNTRNDWKNLLKIINEDLKPHGLKIDINDNDEQGFFKCDILKDGEVIDNYAENFYEEELEELAHDAWAFVKANFI